ncbi:hypothetical protein IQ251_05215 [Saccharopolyspora sp. HNM0983]|uniref:Uncharacterized protein n=1 Tax=Saccharopolyspora montiporae TaxID=2781240 RepID=A0A929B7U0_9PSEU|nr:hypothetical protein [Saccharopolyspora sp. HNM0983]MBE9373846.1 hypothetical protein [Saccharopolyspora sp. HNM0983]
MTSTKLLKGRSLAVGCAIIVAAFLLGLIFAPPTLALQYAWVGLAGSLAAIVSMERLYQRPVLCFIVSFVILFVTRTGIELMSSGSRYFTAAASWSFLISGICSLVLLGAWALMKRGSSQGNP